MAGTPHHFVRRVSVRRAVAVVASIAIAVAGLTSLGQGVASGHAGIAHDPASSALLSSRVIPGPVKLKTQGDATLATSRVVLPDGAHTRWHYHPGPHIVTVLHGTIAVYTVEGDRCVAEEFTAGQTFIDNAGADHVHAVYNRPSTPLDTADTAELRVVDLRTEGEPLTVFPDFQPPVDCFTG